MRVLKDNVATIVCGILVVAAIIASFVLTARAATRAVAQVTIHDGDGGVRTLPLSTDARVEVSTSLGTNVILIQDGSARMAEADCPNGDCLRQRPISRAGEQIICLPHRLWLEVTVDGDAGKGMDADAVAYGNTSEVDLVTR